jgi:hypothetical protein
MTRRVLRIDLDGGSRFRDVDPDAPSAEVIEQATSALRLPAGFAGIKHRVLADEPHRLHVEARYVRKTEPQ